MPRQRSSRKSDEPRARSPKNNYRHGDELGIPSCSAHMWTRVVRVHAIVNRQERIGAMDLAREMEVSYRSIMRTVEFMRERLEIPIVNDRSRGMYYFTTPCPFLPQVRVDADEKLVLKLVRYLLPAVAGSPARMKFEGLLKKLALVVGSNGPLLTEARPSVLVPTALPNAGEFRHLAVIGQAIDRGEELRVQYRKSGCAEVEARVVQPLDFAYLDQRWVLIVLDEGRERALRTFRLDRIQAVALTGTTFVRPANLDVAEILRGNMGAFTGREEHEVRIRLRSFAAEDARTCKWHPSQTEVEHDDGGLEITLRLNNLVDVATRILKWSPHAEAVFPPELRTRVREALQAGMALHQ